MNERQYLFQNASIYIYMYLVYLKYAHKYAYNIQLANIHTERSTTHTNKYLLYIYSRCYTYTQHSNAQIYTHLIAHEHDKKLHETPYAHAMNL